MQIPQPLKTEILAHAKQMEPHESCGFVVLKGEQMIYQPCQNIADNPEQYFEISPDDWISAEQTGKIIALVHSHPDNPQEQGLPYLSSLDRACQVRTELDFWLVCQEQIFLFRFCPPLLGRAFENNKFDCRNIVLDSYMLAGKDFPDDVRYEFEWFETGADLYQQNLIRFGFEKLKPEQSPQLGDIVLIQVGSQVPNHAGIYLGQQLMLHHSQHRLSARVPYDGFWLNHTHSIWRYKQWQQLHFTAILNDLHQPPLS